MTPDADAADPAVLKPAVFLAALGPLAWLVYNAFWGDLGANPIETITNTTGIWTLRFIVITLAITPIRWLTKWNPIITFRRMIGLFAFFYGTLHFIDLLRPRSLADVRRAVGGHRQAAVHHDGLHRRSC